MVAADDKDLSAILHQPGHKAVEQRHRLRLGRGALIDVTRNQDGINLLLTSDLNDLIQDSFLVIQQQQVVHLLAKV